MILVTGGTGYIGRHLVNALVGRSTPVRVLVRDSTRASILPTDAAIVSGSLGDPGSLDRAVTGIRAVVHLAAVTSATEPNERALLATNVEGTAALAKAAQAAGVEHVVYVSSAGVYGIRGTLDPITERDPPDPNTVYQRAKLAGEEAVQAHAASWTVLRPSDVFGAARPQTATFLNSVSGRRRWLHTGATTLENPAYVHDVVAAILLALDQPRLRGEVINIAGPRVLTHREVVDLTAAALGKMMSHLTLPRALTAPASGIAAGLWGLAGRPLPPRLALMRRSVINRGISTDKARRLGIASTPFERAIADVIHAERADGHSQGRRDSRPQYR